MEAGLFSAEPFNPLCTMCRNEFPGNEPRPSCNECECCFCSVDCRERFHSTGLHWHDYSKPLADI